MKKRIITLLLLVALIISVLSSFVISTKATDLTPDLSIDYCNLSFRNSVCIKYAVKSNVKDVKILIWTSPEDKYTVGTHDGEITEYYEENIDGTFYAIFDYTDLTAKQMTDVIYARAYSQVDGVDYYSDVNKYSILQYAYNKLGKTATASTDTELKEMLINMLEYGAAAQKYLDDYKVDRLATADWYQIKVKTGVLDDGCTHGLYLAGDSVTLTAPEFDADGATFAYWVDSRGNKVADIATCELIVGERNEVYTPVYVKYSIGLEFDSNGDGSCYIIGMGDCTDTELIIPPKSLSGDSVIGIDGNAFSGEDITSVSIPSTVKEIARRAFNNCIYLTDVYYDGTEEEWNEISISSGNDALEDAVKHFYKPAAEIFTVVFIDHNGNILKTDYVESGNDATAPADPIREGYTFIGWSGSYTNVTNDLTIIAQYIGEPKFVVSTVTAEAGTTDVVVTVSVENNPGILGMILKLKYDDSILTLTKASKGAALYSHSLTNPGMFISGCNFVIDAMQLEEEDYEDGVILTFRFSVSESATAGSYDVEISYEHNAIKGENYAPINNVIIENGAIIVE